MSDDLISAAELVSAVAARTAAGPGAASSGSVSPVLLDVRWTSSAGADRKGYLAKRIPGAVYVDLDADLAEPPGEGGRHPLPEVERLQECWRRSGIDDSSSVVVYDGADSSGAVRAWWLLRWSGLNDVRVLDGGLGRWPGPFESGEPEPPRRGTATVRPGGMPTVDIDTAANLAVEPWSTLLDARAAPRYRGETEPLDPVPGHIPGSVNLPYSKLYRTDGTLRPADELAMIFEQVGVAAGEPVGASCGSGVTACHLVLAGRSAGFELALYPGSYSQWSRSGRVVEKSDGLAF